ncbi:hypothetical protein CKAH01_00892 [Colletotrichum kahawae]|uniref:Uncharacterized protein n=1 Tax=Colletotrichum kahawae TaxID=34407 RepID=A0AAE0DB88_COLKA|nr:hypothetical protein CKAH01_00892 [Colletotrichum kahawae]
MERMLILIMVSQPAAPAERRALEAAAGWFLTVGEGSAGYVHLAMHDAAETAVPEICTASTTCSAVISSPVGRGLDLKKKTRRRGHPSVLAVHATPIKRILTCVDILDDRQGTEFEAREESGPGILTNSLEWCRSQSWPSAELRLAPDVADGPVRGCIAEQSRAEQQMPPARLSSEVLLRLSAGAAAARQW